MLSVVYVECHNKEKDTKCRYARLGFVLLGIFNYESRQTQCCYAECRYAELYYAECG